MKMLLLGTSATRRAGLGLVLAGVTAAPILVWQAQQGTVGGKSDGASITGSGSSAATGNGRGNSGNGGGNSGGPVTPPAKTFQISGTLGGVAPSSTRQLVLTVTNPSNQTIKVTALSASVAGIRKAAGAPAGPCSATGLLQVGSWTGPAFTVNAGQTRPITGHIPLTLSNSSGDGCQGATFSLNYSGSAVQQ